MDPYAERPRAAYGSIPETSKRAMKALGPWPLNPDHFFPRPFSVTMVLPVITASRPGSHRRVTTVNQQTHLPTKPICFDLVQPPARSHVWSLQTGVAYPPILAQAYPKFGNPSGFADT